MKVASMAVQAGEVESTQLPSFYIYIYIYIDPIGVKVLYMARQKSHVSEIQHNLAGARQKRFYSAWH